MSPRIFLGLKNIQKTINLLFCFEHNEPFGDKSLHFGEFYFDLVIDK
jgi:hypothetical protein